MIFGLLPADSIRTGLEMSVGMELYEFHPSEEIADFEGGGFGRVRTVRAVELDARAQFLSNRPRGSFRGIGCTHGFAPFCDGSFRFENHHHAFAGAHEFGELAEKWTGAVNSVKPFRLRLRQADGLDRRNLKFCGMDAA